MEITLRINIRLLFSKIFRQMKDIVISEHSNHTFLRNDSLALIYD
jgi:hypothetical protein